MYRLMRKFKRYEDIEITYAVLDDYSGILYWNIDGKFASKFTIEEIEELTAISEFMAYFLGKEYIFEKEEV